MWPTPAKRSSHARAALEVRKRPKNTTEIAELKSVVGKLQGELEMLKSATPVMLPVEERERRLERSLAGRIDESEAIRDPAAVERSRARFEQLRSEMNGALQTRLEKAKQRVAELQTRQAPMDAQLRESMEEIADIERVLRLRVETEAERRARYTRDFFNSVRNHVQRTNASLVLAQRAVNVYALTEECTGEAASGRNDAADACDRLAVRGKGQAVQKDRDEHSGLFRANHRRVSGWRRRRRRRDDGGVDGG